MKEKKPINVQIGMRIKQARLAAGMTQEEFSEIVQLGVKHISMIECGTTGVSLSVLQRICKTLNVTSDELLFGRSERNDATLLAQRMERLRPDHFAIVSDIVTRLLAAFSEDYP